MISYANACLLSDVVLQMKKRDKLNYVDNYIVNKTVVIKSVNRVNCYMSLYLLHATFMFLCLLCGFNILLTT